MVVVIDEKIPYIIGVLSTLADEVRALPGDKITRDVVKDADALIVRTRTKCNKALLEGTNVKFIATATIGYDHIDTQYCAENGITWTNAPGCNANSVAEYIESALLLLEEKHHLQLSELTIGIIGVGNVGSKVHQIADKYHIKVLLNDPPRAEAEGKEGFSSLDEIAEKADIITFHTPLARGGKHPTFHLADEHFLSKLKKRPILFNTSRGEVVDTKALLKAIDKKELLDVVIDVWENEPDIDLTLLDKAFIATPHIAGYSADGKGNATRMSLESICRFFKIDANFQIAIPSPQTPPELFSVDYHGIPLVAYNPTTDSTLLKAHPEKFEWFRNNYPLRRETKMYYEKRNETSGI